VGGHAACEVMALDGAGEALPMVVPVTSTASPALNSSTVISEPARKLGALFVAEPELMRVRPGATFAFA